MNLIDALAGEHGAFKALLRTVEQSAETGGDLAQIEGALAALAAEVAWHAAFEEEFLFPVLKPLLEDDDLISKMCAQHRQIRSGLERIEDAASVQQAVDAVRKTFAIARHHFQNEEEILYPLARRIVDEETLVRLGKDWAKARQVKNC